MASDDLDTSRCVHSIDLCEHKCLTCGTNDNMHPDDGMHNIVTEWDGKKVINYGCLCNKCHDKALLHYVVRHAAKRFIHQENL